MPSELLLIPSGPNARPRWSERRACAGAETAGLRARVRSRRRPSQAVGPSGVPPSRTPLPLRVSSGLRTGFPGPRGRDRLWGDASRGAGGWGRPTPLATALVVVGGHLAMSPVANWHAARHGSARLPAPSGADVQRGPGPEWGHGAELLQGTAAGQAPSVPPVHGPGGGGAGPAAPAARGLGLAVRGAPERGVPGEAGRAGLHRVAVAGLGGGGLSHAGSEPGAGYASGADSRRRWRRHTRPAGLLFLARTAQGGGAEVRRRRAALPRGAGAQAAGAGRHRTAAVPPHPAAMVPGGALAERCRPLGLRAAVGSAPARPAVRDRGA